MREIKFRAWDKDEKRMIFEKMAVMFNGTILFAQLGGIDKEGYEGNYNWLTRDNAFELMQYTGLKDKNGKEIYEGDIINYWDLESADSDTELPDEDNIHTQEVKWSSEGGYFCKDELFDDYLNALGNEDVAIEIIGNIYENPELLALK